MPSASLGATGAGLRRHVRARLPQQDIEQGMDRGRAEGARGNAEAMLLRLPAARFGSVDANTRERLAAASTEQLNAWSERVLPATTADEVFADNGAG